MTLAGSGTATPGGDYELDGSPAGDSGEGGTDVQVVIEAGADNAFATLRSIPDFEEEGNKSIELSVVTANGSRFNGSGPSVSLELLDEGAMFPDAKDRLTSARPRTVQQFQAGQARITSSISRSSISAP